MVLVDFRLFWSPRGKGEALSILIQIWIREGYPKKSHFLVTQRCHIPHGVPQKSKDFWGSPGEKQGSIFNIIEGTVVGGSLQYAYWQGEVV